MFNSAGSARRYNHWKVLGGSTPADYESHRTMFAGPDPADPSKVLVRKLIQTGEKTWCFEESRISNSSTEGGIPTVHTTIHRLGTTDIREEVDDKEHALRVSYKPISNVVGFSLFARAYEGATSGSFTIVENSLTKPKYRWAEWLRDLSDKRDMAAYLKFRWMMN